MLRQRETKQNKTKQTLVKQSLSPWEIRQGRSVDVGINHNGNWFRREAMNEAKADSETSSLELKASFSFHNTFDHPRFEFKMKNFLTGRNVAQLDITSWGIISGKQPSIPLAGIRHRSGQLDTSLINQQTSPLHLIQSNIRKSSLSLRRKV